jgi:plastocyanin
VRFRITATLAAAGALAALMLVTGFRSAGSAGAAHHHHATAAALPPALAGPDRSYRALLAKLGPCPGAGAQVRAAARLRSVALRGAATAAPASVRRRAADLRRARGLLARARTSCVKPVAPTPLPPTTTTSPPATTPPPAVAAQVVEIGADPSGLLRFVQPSLAAHAGALTIHFTNPSGVPHSVGITGNGVSVGPSAVVSGGASVNLEANLPPGVYTVFCGVGQHAALGMTIPLTVS